MQADKKRIMYLVVLIYSVLFWYFAHPLWTERWIEITGGIWLTTSNFICGLIYIGGFAVLIFPKKVSDELAGLAP